MRIGIAIEYFAPRLGGAERSTDQIARELLARGHHVTIIAGAAPVDAMERPDDPSAAQPELQCWRRQRKPRTGAAALRFSHWARRTLRAGDFDVTLSMTSIVPAQIVQPRAGVIRESMIRALPAAGPAVARIWRRGGQMLSIRKWSLLHLERQTFNDSHVRRFVAISHYMRRQMMSHYDVPSDRITVIPNAAGVPEVTERARAELRRTLRHDRGWSDEEGIVFFPALDPRRKGMAPLLKAMRLVVNRRPLTRLAVVGRTPPWAKRMARSLGIADRVQSLGVIPRMDALYCAVDVTAIPTYYDPASKVVMESMVMGTPVVTSCYNGSADWIESCGDPDLGRIVDEPDDIETLADTIVDMLGTTGSFHDAQERSPLAGIDMRQMTMTAHVDRLEALLSSVASAPTSSA